MIADLPAVAQVIETAAPLGQGLVQLEEALLFQSELMSLQASHSRPAVGSVVEARVVKGQGAMATIIVKRGTLKACMHPCRHTGCLMKMQNSFPAQRQSLGLVLQYAGVGGKQSVFN